VKRWAWLGLLGLLLAGCSSAAASSSGVPGIGGVACVTSTAVPGLDAEQTANARTIISTAYSLGAGDAGAKIAVTVALTEASLRNVNHGDTAGPDSIGLFQQRTGWGPLSVRTDPVGATTLFFTANSGPGVTGLLHIPNWQNMSIPLAAQAVEHSQFSDGSNYAVNVPLALTAVAALGPTCHSVITGGTAKIPGGMNPSQDPTTFGWVRAGPQEPLVWQGHDFGQVAAGTAKLWAAMLTELVPQIPGGLDGNIGCYDNRQNVNNPSMASFHAFGLACDLNSGVNSNGTPPQALQGRTGALPMTTGSIVAKYGMQWGGDFTGTPDPMHIELHLSPQQVASATATSAV
jgi:hypothetical protein